MSRLLLLEPLDVPDAVKRWPSIAGMLQMGVDRAGGVMTLESIGKDLREDKLQLWLVLDDQVEGFAVIGLWVTHLGYERSGMKTCTVYLCAGKGMRGELGHRETMEAWARDTMHCHRIVIYGRKGWARELPDYDLTQYVLTKDLTHGRRQPAGDDDTNRPVRGGSDPDERHPGEEPTALQHGGAESLHGPTSRGVYH